MVCVISKYTYAFVGFDIIIIVMYGPFCVFCLTEFFVLIVCKCVLDYCHRDIGALFDYPN
jgi:hypothetical protein